MTTSKNYDVIIIGSGPAGLSLAQGCSYYGKKVLVIDKESSIGGCHRVRRVNNTLFTEHGPRIYSTNYQTFKQFLKNIDIKFNDIFVKANNVLPITYWIQQISLCDVLCLLWTTVFTSTFFKEYGKDISMQEYMNSYGFSKESQYAIDTICRSTDGASSDKYTCFEFFNIIHQHALYTIMEPKQPTDTELFPLWQSKLQNTGLVDFLLGTSIQQIQDHSVVYNSNQKVTADNIVLAIPPESIVSLLQTSNSDTIKNAFGNIDTLNSWAQHTSYKDYISFTIHYDQTVNIDSLKREYSPWGIVFVNLSKYMKFVDIDKPTSTVFSCIITKLDVPSPITGLTANQTLDSNELLDEAVRQLYVATKGLPKFKIALLSPGTFRNTQEQPNHWDDVDTAFMLVPNATFLQQHSNLMWLWNVGSHNGYQKYNFTSLESAVSNSAALLHKWFPNTDVKEKFPIIAPLELRTFILLFWIISFVIVLFKSS